MLNFDCSHKSINGKFSKIDKKIKVKDILLKVGLVSSILLFSGCAKNMECDIGGLHAHKYVNDSYVRYVVSEKEHLYDIFDSWDRSEEYISISKEDLELLDFIYDNDLFRISDNIDNLIDEMDSKKDYIEYEYKYMVMSKVGNVTVPKWHTSWTSNPETHSESLTGKERVVHHVYYGYKIIKDENDNYQKIKSDPVDDLRELQQGYDYIDKNYSEKVYFDAKEYDNSIVGLSL